MLKDFALEKFGSHMSMTHISSIKYFMGIRRNVSEQGLKSLYNLNKDFKTGIRWMSSLPLLPIGDVTQEYELGQFNIS